MRNYRINYIDSHDSRYKSFETSAQSENKALANLMADYKDGTRDHKIVEIIEIKDSICEGLRIGKGLLSPPPFTRQAPLVDGNNIQ